MWWSDTSKVLRGAVAAVLVSGALAGCTVEPLYGVAGRPDGPAAYHIKPVGNRDDQQVRNGLIFALNGGENPSDAPFDVELAITKSILNVVVEAGQQAPTTSRVNLKALYTVRNARGETVATGTRSAIGAFDRFNQQFAIARAEREAVDRTAKVLARRIALAIRQQMSSVSPALAATGS